MLHEKKRGVALAPHDARARVAYAEALLGDGQREAAVAELERAVALDGAFAPARRLLAHTLVAQGRTTLAARSLEAVLEATPDDVVSAAVLADLHVGAHRPDDALLVLEVALAARPDARELRASAAALCLQRGLVDRAAAHVARCRDLDTRGPAAADTRLAALEAELLRAGGHQDVSAALHADGTVLQGRVLELLGRIEHGPAARELEAVTAAVRSDDARAAKRALLLVGALDALALDVIRGELALWLGERDVAQRALSRAATREPEGARDAALVAHACVRTGELALERRDLEAARVAFARATTLDSDSAHAFEGLGDALLDVDAAGALDAYRQAAARAPLGPALAKRARLQARVAPWAAGRIEGLAWTPVGGVVSDIEAVCVGGTGRAIATGNVLAAIREASDVALTAVRARADALGVGVRRTGFDVHLHFDETGVTKDGPSAGLPFALACASSLADRPLRQRLAATGEMTPSGAVKPVGGIHEKLVAAFLAGVERVLVPARNAGDVAALPAAVRRGIEIVLVETLVEAHAHALPDERPRGR